MRIPPWNWDLFCRVIDNYGDIGVCWRLARQLAREHGIRVRLWVDRLESFARLCPEITIDASVQMVDSIEIHSWDAEFPEVAAADVVIEAFACELPESYIAAMARRIVPPVWINLEYLSAEEWVTSCHLLPSPHPGSGLRKFFFFPGLTLGTGGLLRERDLLARRDAFSTESDAFWIRMGIPVKSATAGDSTPLTVSDAELRLSLFCYANPALPDLLRYWSTGTVTVRVLAAAGAASDQIGQWLGKPFPEGAVVRQGNLIVHALPFLTQDDYDRLLWECDINFVRGEDSFVRAQWAQRPFVWQIYPQEEDAHFVKLNAFLNRYLADFPCAEAVRRCWLAWNGVGDIGNGWRDYAAMRMSVEKHGKDWVSQLDRAGNLANNLVSFAELDHCGGATPGGCGS